MTPTFDPILPWPVLLVGAALIVALTLWAYRLKLRGTSGRWRWFALGLRLAAILLCILAALRPSVLVSKKDRQKTELVVLSDQSTSMGIRDMPSRQTRWAEARKAVEEARTAVKTLGPDLTTRFLRFDTDIYKDNPDDQTGPKGQATALGTVLEKVARESTGAKPVGVVVLADGNSNTGRDPRFAAQLLRSRQVPIIAVGYGGDAGTATRDVAVREVVTGDPVYEKTELEVRGTIRVRGFPGRTLKVKLRAENVAGTIATAEVKVPEGSVGTVEVPVRGLKWTPRQTGEVKVRLEVEPLDGEQVQANNTYETFVTVLKGGINALFLSGPHAPWEGKYLSFALGASPKIQLTFKQLHEPDTGLLDADFTPRRYDVYIIGDLPAEFLRPVQVRALVQNVARGAGLMMLGGRSSFGAGGWANTELADVLPVRIHGGDGQIEPPDGLKVIANIRGPENFLLKLAPDPVRSLEAWKALPPISGTNRFGEVKPGAIVLAQAPDGEPLMVAQGDAKGRVLIFGGETWPWFRYSDQTQAAHLRFWRNAILWLAHKEDEGEDQVKLALDRRRVARGQKLELTAGATSPKGDPLTDVQFTATVRRDAPEAKPETFQMFAQGSEARNSHFATGPPGQYQVVVKGVRNGQEIGSARARFLVYQDDRELENPAADPDLLRQLAAITGGKFLQPEQLPAYLKTLDKELVVESMTQKEVRIWDNWPFLLIFTALLTLEWWLRKRHGWV